MWYGGAGGAGVGSTPANANYIDASGTPTYNFSLSLKDTASGMEIIYSLQGDNSPAYTASGTVLDSSGTMPLTFDAVGFYADSFDTAFGGGVSFSGLTETYSPVPEPATMALFGFGSLVSIMLIRRRK
jgi:hypothetical protein